MPVLEASTRDVTAERTRSIPSSCQAGGRDWNQPHLISRFPTHLAAILQQARNFGRNFAVAAAGYLHTVLPVGVNRRHEVDLEDGTKQLEHLRGQHLGNTWTANKRCETCRIGEGARWHGKGREKKHRENYYFFCRYDVEYSFGHVQTYSNVFRGGCPWCQLRTLLREPGLLTSYTHTAGVVCRLTWPSRVAVLPTTVERTCLLRSRYLGAGKEPGGSFLASEAGWEVQIPRSRGRR